jgi:hypothetical protein
MRAEWSRHADTSLEIGARVGSRFSFDHAIHQSTPRASALPQRNCETEFRKCVMVITSQASFIWADELSLNVLATMRSGAIGNTRRRRQPIARIAISRKRRIP